MTVKSAAFDSKLGGRDMDWAIAQHAADEFQAKTGNVREREREAIEKTNAPHHNLDPSIFRQGIKPGAVREREGFVTSPPAVIPPWNDVLHRLG